MELFFKVICAVRLVSVPLVQTWFVPDEYWQSLEVAHYLVFNYGYLTWEWAAGIRSILYPVLVAFSYIQLKFFGVNNASALVAMPRILQALFTCWTEFKFIKITKRNFHTFETRWLIFLNCGSYFLFYIGSRTLANTVEMNLVLLGIAYFAENQYGKFFVNIAVSCYIRPTCSPIWLPFIIYFLITKQEWLKSIPNLITLVKCSLPVLSIILLDSVWYGHFTLVPLEFLRFNFLNDFAKFYGEHSWHWYFTNGLPSLVGPLLIFVPSSLWTGKKLFSHEETVRDLIKFSCLAFLIAHSMVGHKEIRFLAPLVPLLNYLIVPTISKLKFHWKKILAVVYLAMNVPAALYLGLRHQRGVMDAVNYLAEQINSNDTALFLMPCHSTPLYSHIHVNATLRFLTCPPNFENKIDYQDEADVFYRDPKTWVDQHLNDINPDFLILFDVLYEQLAEYLRSPDIMLIGDFFHADFHQGRIGSRVLIFRKWSKA